jgi:hypothetical protein
MEGGEGEEDSAVAYEVRNEEKHVLLQRIWLLVGRRVMDRAIANRRGLAAGHDEGGSARSRGKTSREARNQACVFDAVPGSVRLADPGLRSSWKGG